MLDRKDIKDLAKARHNDALVLLRGKRYESAMYLCGYAIEAFFESANLSNLEMGRISRRGSINRTLFTEWSAVAQWNPESRYRPIGKATAADAARMVASTQILLGKL